MINSHLQDLSSALSKANYHCKFFFERVVTGNDLESDLIRYWMEKNRNIQKVDLKKIDNWVGAIKVILVDKWLEYSKEKMNETLPLVESIIIMVEEISMDSRENEIFELSSEPDYFGECFSSTFLFVFGGNTYILHFGMND